MDVGFGSNCLTALLPIFNIEEADYRVFPEAAAELRDKMGSKPRGNVYF